MKSATQRRFGATGAAPTSPETVTAEPEFVDTGTYRSKVAPLLDLADANGNGSISLDTFSERYDELNPSQRPGAADLRVESHTAILEADAPARAGEVVLAGRQQTRRLPDQQHHHHGAQRQRGSGQGIGVPWRPTSVARPR